MKSAYASSQCSHGEPDFTNYARIKEDEPFIGTLDYIFLNKDKAGGVLEDWDVVKVDPVVHRNDMAGPLPNEEEPSDHVAIGADLILRG